MTSRARGIRVPERLDREIRHEAESRGKSWSATTQELIDEAIRMRRAPGVVLAEGQTGRRAVIAGSGVDVWEVIASWRSMNEDYERLRAGYHWLTEPQLRAALSYYRLYPREIDDRLERERSWTPERVRRELPFARPSGTR